MLPVEAAILRTILYADIFNFPLTSDEIQRYLITDVAIAQADIDKTLQHSECLNQLICNIEHYYCLRDRERIIAIRKEREAISQKLWNSAIHYGKLLSYIPFVEMVALTGALAVRNPSSIEDDFDYLLITRPGRVWLARAFAVLMVRIVRLFGRELCPNYVLASDQLAQSRQDLYMAHEITQMRPIYGADLYRAIFTQNPWTGDYLPNALPYATEADKPRRLRSILEWLLRGRIGDILEQREYQRKLRKFQPKMHQTTSSAEISENSVKGHFEDHGMPVLRHYEALLAEYGLLDTVEAMAGD